MTFSEVLAPDIPSSTIDFKYFNPKIINNTTKRARWEQSHCDEGRIVEFIPSVVIRIFILGWQQFSLF
jgi:hypothetical protein